MKTKQLLLALVAVLAFSASTACALSINTVTVGNPGNAEDHDYHTDPIKQGPNDGGRGDVAYTYEMGKYEVTNAEYTEFLNAVAATDTHSLWNFGMGVFFRGGISRSGTSGSFTYTTMPNMNNKPVIRVSFWDAARFVNWLHNGQPTGSQNATTTEDGAYTLGGVTNPDNLTIFRNVGATWFIPDENEWYKAAFHQPVSQGGDSDDYWMYPTASNVEPILATATATGDIANPGPNVANHDEEANWNGSTEGNATSVGSAGPQSESYYGTADQAGNVWEWYETIVLTSIELLDVDGRGVWGGAYDINVGNSRADHVAHHDVATVQNWVYGFRVARYAETSLFEADFDLDNDVDSADLTHPTLGWYARYGVDLDGSDFLTWQRELGSGINPLSLAPAAIPEPSSSLLIVGLAGIAALVRFRTDS